jgi:SAM-dependent methyltransferase
LNDPRSHVDMDVTKLDFDDGTVSEIMASHLFEHISPFKVEEMLRDWLRVLKPGGRLVMELPNIEELCRRFVTASKGERYGILNAVYGSVNTTALGLPSDITSPHLFGWWPEAMFDMLSHVGYVNIRFGPEQWPHPESNFRVEAEKRR